MNYIEQSHIRLQRIIKNNFDNWMGQIGLKVNKLLFTIEKQISDIEEYRLKIFEISHKLQSKYDTLEPQINKQTQLLSEIVKEKEQIKTLIIEDKTLGLDGLGKGISKLKEDKNVLFKEINEIKSNINNITNKVDSLIAKTNNNSKTTDGRISQIEKNVQKLMLVEKDTNNDSEEGKKDTEE